MRLRCPACEYDLSGRASDICPECGGSFTHEQLVAHARTAAHPHPRADMVFHGCAILAFLFFSGIFALIGVGYFAPVPMVIASVFLLVAVGLGFSLRRVAKRRRHIRDDD